MPYAIRNRKTKKFVTGTDYRYNPPHQVTSKTCAYIYEDEWDAVHGKNMRDCGKDYEIVPVRIEVIENAHGECNQCRHYEGVCGVQGHAPSVERPHGKWIYDEKSNVYRCSGCGQFPSRVITEKDDKIFTDFYRSDSYKFCPNCGADMRREGENE